MTRKDYLNIARIIKVAREQASNGKESGPACNAVIHNIVEGFCGMLKQDNHAFDKERFKEACK